MADVESEPVRCRSDQPVDLDEELSLLLPNPPYSPRAAVERLQREPLRLELLLAPPAGPVSLAPAPAPCLRSSPPLQVGPHSFERSAAGGCAGSTAVEPQSHTTELKPAPWPLALRSSFLVLRYSFLAFPDCGFLCGILSGCCVPAATWTASAATARTIPARHVARRVAIVCSLPPPPS